jgi:hypothetical protein
LIIEFQTFSFLLREISPIDIWGTNACIDNVQQIGIKSLNTM